jgi:uncharacterized protein YvpB
MSTKLFKVITNKELRVRTSPLISRGNLVPNRYLTYGDVLEVRADSETQASGWTWWEHSNSPGCWTASQSIDNKNIFMIEYQQSHIAAPEADLTQIFEVVTDYLMVRSEPRFGNNIRNGTSLRRGQRVAFHNPKQTDGYQWWEQVDNAGFWSSSGSISGEPLMIPVGSTEVTTQNTYIMTVPWITQIQSPVNFKNDCGHTCTLMLLRYLGKGQNLTVKEMYDLEQFRHPEGWTSAAQLEALGKHYYDGSVKQFAQQTINDADMDTLKQMLREKGPVIILVWYPSLSFNNPSNGSFNHWVVITGHRDDTFFINDPLWLTENKGVNRAITRATLLNACRDVRNSNDKFTGIHPA